MLLMLVVAAAAMTSCTSDEVVEMNPANAIKFESFVNKGTRAVTEVNNLTGFYVFGGYDGNNVFNNTSVTPGVSTGEYWVSGKVYNFAAYSNGDDIEIASDVSFDGSDLEISNYNVYDVNDLVAAVTKNHPSGTTVSLNFKHLLAQVKFTLTNSYQGGDANLYMTLSNLSFESIKSGATCTFDGTDATWTDGTGTIAKYEYELYKEKNGSSLQSPAEISGIKLKKGESITTISHMVIPGQTLTNVKVKFVAKFYSGNDELLATKDFTTTGISLATSDTDDRAGKDNSISKWKAGYRYNYTAQLPFSPNFILFNVEEIQDWEDSNDNQDISPAQ